MAIVTLTTDFGTLYPASLKAVILSICPGTDIVDVTHSVPHADIRAGAFALCSVVEYFPAGTVHVAVVDPGVGTSRRSVVIHSGGHYFMGPDNGLMLPAARKLGTPEVFEISNRDLLGAVSSTFHGRDIFARIGALIAKGIDVKEVGGRIDDYIDLDLSGALVWENCIEAEVIFVDDFGNVITNIPHDIISSKIIPGAMLHIQGRDVPYLQTYGKIPVGDVLCLIGSHGFFEIAVNQGSAARTLGLHNGARISVRLPGKSV